MGLKLILGWLSPFPVFSLHIAWVSSLCYSIFLLALLGFPLRTNQVSSLHYFKLFFTLLSSPLCVILFSSLQSWALLCDVALLSSWCCPTLLCVAQLSFVMLFSFLCCLAFLFVLFSSSVALLFQVQGSLCYCFHLRGAAIGVLLFIENPCTTPLHSFL